MALTMVGSLLLGALLAQTPMPSASPWPAASAAPSAPSDPCGSLLSIVNRPSFGTGVCTVRTGYFEIESGYTNTVTSGPGGGNSAVYPQSLVRIGSFDPHLDFEFGAPSFNLARTGTTLGSGWGDTNVGAKYELGYTSAAVWGVNAVVTLPTGVRGFTAGNAQFTGNVNWAYTLNSQLGVSGTLGVNALSANDAAGVAQSYFAFTPTIELSATFPGGPSQLSAEYAYVSAAGPNLGGRSWLDFVYVRDFGPTLQADVEYGVSPTPIGGQKQHYVGAGLSFMRRSAPEPAPHQQPRPG